MLHLFLFIYSCVQAVRVVNEVFIGVKDVVDPSCSLENWLPCMGLYMLCWGGLECSQPDPVGL